MHLGFEVVESLKEGANSKSYRTCLQKIEMLTRLPQQTIKVKLESNTEAAINIARHFGAEEASDLIYRTVENQLDSTLPTQNQATSDHKQIQF
ncbi:MAG: hypothetical protein Kow0065_11230 [Methylomicrobium sp.]